MSPADVARALSRLSITAIAVCLAGCGGGQRSSSSPSSSPAPAATQTALPRDPAPDEPLPDERAGQVDPADISGACRLVTRHIARGSWQRAQELRDWLGQNSLRVGTVQERSGCYRDFSRIDAHAGDFYRSAESLVIALEIWPENYDALRALLALSRERPAAYAFAGVLRELDRVYRERGSQAGLELLHPQP